MPTPSEDIAGKNREAGGRAAGTERFFWSRLTELWILMAIAIFFLIRVLGSQVAQRLLNNVGFRHFQ